MNAILQELCSYFDLDFFTIQHLQSSVALSSKFLYPFPLMFFLPCQRQKSLIDVVIWAFFQFGRVQNFGPHPDGTVMSVGLMT